MISSSEAVTHSGIVQCFLYLISLILKAENFIYQHLSSMFVDFKLLGKKVLLECEFESVAGFDDS